MKTRQYLSTTRATPNTSHYTMLCAALIMATLYVLLPATARGEEVRVGSLKISAPWSRATPGGAKVGGGYLVIENTGTTDDRLVAGETVIAGSVEIHEMKMEGDIMRMRALENGLVIPAGKTVHLKPGGYHVMFIGLKQGLIEGSSFKARFKFEKAGEIELDFKVGKLGARSMGGTKPMHHHQ